MLYHDHAHNLVGCRSCSDALACNAKMYKQIYLSMAGKGLKPSWSGRVVYSTELTAQRVMGLSPGLNLHPTNACRHVCRYVDQKGSAAMLTSIQSAGVTSEGEDHTGEKACKKGSTMGLKPREDINKKNLCPSKNLQKKNGN